jgi:hypothetical protein
MLLWQNFTLFDGKHHSRGVQKHKIGKENKLLWTGFAFIILSKHTI